MDEKPDEMFDAPIPGMGMTHELGARPWQNPPRFSTVEQTIKFYTERMSTDAFADKLVDVLEMGVPVTTVADVMMMNGVMEGSHSVDVGILVLPVLMEFMMLIADSAGIDYTTGMDETDDRPSKGVMNKSIKQFKKEREQQDVEPEVMIEEEPVQAEADKPVGLMARRA